MPNGIYLTLEQYKDKDLPITITINGHTYHSQFALATTQTTWFEMGKQHGMELGSDNTYSDNEMSNMHDAWFDEGYTKGYEAGYDAGIDHGIEKTLQDDRVKEELERTKQTWYAKGKEEGYEAGKWDLPAGDSGVENLTYKHGWSCGYNEGFEIGKSAGYNDGFEEGKSEVFEEGKSEGYDEGYEAGKSESYGRGWIEGHNEASIKQFDEYSVKLEERYKSKYDAGFNDGYEQCKHDGISKINLNTESVEQTELSKEYDKGFTKGYEEGKEAGKKEALAEIEVEFPTYKHGWSCGFNDGFEEGKSEGYDEGYEIGKKANGISTKEIPGEWLSRIEEARLMGYEQGRSDCREATLQKKLLQEHIMEYGRDEHGVIMECGDDEEDGELIGPEHPEYDKGYYAGWEDGKNHIMQFIGNESSR
jgi:flagellar biosynthesis/type III secretory pathway protein FliH